MASNTRASTASGVPAHLRATTVAGVESANPHFPASNLSQQPVSAGGVSGINLPVDPLLALAGAYWNGERMLVRRVTVRVGEPRMVDGKFRQPVRSSERFVAPPGTTIEDARARGLDFFSPQYGWIRGGIKREQEYIDNLGTGGNPTDVEYVDVEAGNASEEV